MDSDDWLEQDACERMYRYAQEENLDIVISNFFQDDPSNKISFLKHDLDMTIDHPINSYDYLSLFFLGKSYNAVWNKLFKKSLYKNFRIPNEKLNLGEDLLQTVVLASKAKKIGKINKAFLHYQYNPESITNQQKSKNIYQLFLAYEFLAPNMNPQIYDQFKDKISLDQYKLVASFLSQIPHFQDPSYQKGVEKVLMFLKHNRNIPQEISFIKKNILKLLSKKPTLFVFKLSVFISNILLKHRIVKI